MSNMTEVIEASGEPSAETQVTVYVAAVRIALAGLAPDEVEDLTSGMEADLTRAAGRARRASRGGARHPRHVCRGAAAGGGPARCAGGRERAHDRSRSVVAPPPRRTRSSGRQTSLAAGHGTVPRDAAPGGWVLRGVVAAWLFLVVLRLAYLPTYLVFFVGAADVWRTGSRGGVLIGRWSRRQ